MASDDGFLWGVATAALQIEGAVDRDGRGRSIWEDFQDRPGTIAGGDTVAGGSHHYDHVADDVALMRDLGVDAYRFSVAWPRVVPDGRGEVNPAGLGFYDRLVDELLAADIVPVVTLYHWDLPSTLQQEGGWTRRSTSEAFAAYVRVVAEALGDRVRHFVTHNEPQVVSLVANAEGVHAPGNRDVGTALAVAHELLVSHGMAMHEIREVAPQAQAGITLDINVVAPADPEDPEHVAAARMLDGQVARWFLDPVMGHGYPDDVVAWYGDLAPRPTDDELALMATPTDFTGLNYYRRDTVTPADPDDWAAARPVARDVPTTAMGWEIHPQGLSENVRRVVEAGAPQVMVTENGAAFDDVVTADGRVPDDDRVAYLEAHVAEVQRCRDEGLPLTGYFLWSLLDNFEWAEGYAKRFGIVRSQPDRWVRVPKDSYRWYRDHLASRHGD
jgi:beta-glucosidase